MGPPVSPVSANFYMERFEHMALEKSQGKRKIWHICVDDLWVVFTHGQVRLKLFFLYYQQPKS